MMSDMNCIKIELDTMDFYALKDFLLRHEQEIALGINDFSDLSELFESVMKRHPIEVNSLLG